MLNYDRLRQYNLAPRLGMVTGGYSKECAVEKSQAEQRPKSVREALRRQLHPEDRRTDTERLSEMTSDLFSQIDQTLETVTSYLDEGIGIVNEHADAINKMDERITILTQLVNSLTSAASQNQAAAASTSPEQASDSAANSGDVAKAA